MVLHKWKKTLFTFLLIFTGISAVIFLELVLRFFNVGENYSLLQETTLNGRDFYRVNRSFPGKYFNRVGDAPEFRDELIPVFKQSNEKRIIVLGGSTSFGFPYTYNITFPDMLEWMMKENSPSTRWNVINLSTSAINSFSVADIVKRTADLKPDAIVIYMGHNEFYGAFGSASLEKGGTWFYSTHLSIKIRELRLYQVLLKVFNKSMVSVSPGDPLMVRIIRNKQITFGSSLYLKTRLNFIRNLYRIKQITDPMDIPVYICTLVSNEKDLVPFASDFIDEGLTHPTLYREFQSLLASGDTTGVRLWLKDLYLWEPQSSIYSYCNAKYFEWMGNRDSAGIYYKKARDLDVLRFRATTDWNKAIRQFAVNNSWELVPIDLAFEQYSYPSFPGNDLFHEHVHPNEKGYRLMAYTILKQMEVSGFYPEIKRHDFMNDEEFSDHYPMTPFELRAGELTILKLTGRWPFKAADESFDFTPGNMTDHYVWEYVNNRKTWGESNRELVDYHLKRNDTDLAIRYVKSIQQIIPYEIYPYMKLAEIFEIRNEEQQALKILKSVDQFFDDPAIWLKEGLLYYKLNEPEFAVFALNEARTVLKQKPGLSQDKISDLYEHLISALLLTNNPDTASRVREEAKQLYGIQIKPN